MQLEGGKPGKITSILFLIAIQLPHWYVSSMKTFVLLKTEMLNWMKSQITWNLS